MGQDSPHLQEIVCRRYLGSGPAAVRSPPGRKRGGAMDALSTMTMIDEPAGRGAAPEQGRSCRAPFVTIDYRSIVEGTVAGLAENTPAAPPRGVYAQGPHCGAAAPPADASARGLSSRWRSSRSILTDPKDRNGRRARRRSCVGASAGRPKESAAAQPNASDSLPRTSRGACTSLARSYRVGSRAGVVAASPPAAIRPPAAAIPGRRSFLNRPKIRHRPQGCPTQAKGPSGPLRGVVTRDHFPRSDWAAGPARSLR